MSVAIRLIDPNGIKHELKLDSRTSPTDLEQKYGALRLAVDTATGPPAFCLEDGKTYFVVPKSPFDARTTSFESHAFKGGKYQSMRKLGQGAFGQAYLAKHGNDHVVVKVLKSTSRQERNKIYQEVVSLIKIDSKYVVKMLDVFEESDDHTCLVLNYCAGGTVGDLIRKGSVPFDLTMRIISDGARGLKEMHRREMLHRDIKPDNLFFTDSTFQVQIGDFGLAQAVEDNMYVAGCKPYLAPEVMSSGMTYASDMWALGCVTLCLLTGVTMEQRFQDGWFLEAKSEAEVNEFLRPIVAGLEPVLTTVLRGMLRRDPKQRMTAAEVVDHLSPSAFYVPNNKNTLAFVENLKRRICSEYHDPARTPEAAWGKIMQYALTGHLLLAQLMESTLLSTLKPNTTLKSVQPIVAVLSPQSPRNMSAAGLIEAGLAADPSFRLALSKVLKISGLPSSCLLIGGVKSKHRVNEKMLDNGFSIFDLNRATIVCDEEIEIEKARHAVVSVFGDPLRFKNLFAVDWHDLDAPPCFLFNLALPDCSVNAVMGSRWVVEVQISLKAFMDTKELLHPLYEINRAPTRLPNCPVCHTVSTTPVNPEPEPVQEEGSVASLAAPTVQTMIHASTPAVVSEPEIECCCMHWLHHIRCEDVDDDERWIYALCFLCDLPVQIFWMGFSIPYFCIVCLAKTCEREPNVCRTSCNEVSECGHICAPGFMCMAALKYSCCD